MSGQNTRTWRAAALAYARRGWAVHPVRPGDKRPLLKDWPHQATTDPRTIEAWWARWPNANVGLACGPSGLFVVDLDVKGGADGPASWARLLAGHKRGRAVRYHLPAPAGIVDSRQIDNMPRADNVYEPADGGA